MQHSAFVRLSSGAMIIGGLLATGAMVFHPEDIAAPVSVPVHLALYSGIMIALIGLPGLGARIASKAGTLGLVGMVLLFLGLAFEDPIHSVLAFTVVPMLAAEPATNSLLGGPPPGLSGPIQLLALPVIVAGLIVLALAIWRTGALPRWLIVPLLGTVLLIPLGFAVPALQSLAPGLLYLSLVALGWTLGLSDARVNSPALARQSAAI